MTGPRHGSTWTRPGACSTHRYPRHSRPWWRRKPEDGGGTGRAPPGRRWRPVVPRRADHVARKRGKGGQEAGARAPSRSGESERLRQRDEAHAEGRAFLERRPHIAAGASTPVKLPHQHARKLPLLGGGEQRLALRVVVVGDRADRLHRGDAHPAAAGGERVPRVDLYRQGVWVVGRDTGREGKPTVCLGVTSVVACTYECGSGRNAPTRCALIGGRLGDRCSQC
jgi:hypothetical protein